MKKMYRKRRIVFLLIIGMFLVLYICCEFVKSEMKSEQGLQETSQKMDRLLTLVNNQNEISLDWEVDLVALSHNQSIDRSAYDDLIKMLEDAKKEGMHLLVCSSYRTNDKQEQLYQNKVNEYINKGYGRSLAQREASFWVAKPGTSEHQLGLAIDIVSFENQRLDKSQEDTLEQKWLIKNSWKYGFILRYPSSKSHITGIGYEPWHYRYVGKDNAKRINELGLCLEEYLER